MDFSTVGLNEVIKQFPFVSIYLVGILTYLARNVPMTLWRIICDQFTVRLMLNNIDHRDAKMYENFLTWFQDSKWFSMSRSIRPASHRNILKSSLDNELITIGMGKHFFFFKGRLFWLNCVKSEQKTMTWSSNVQIELSIQTIGRSQKPLIDLIRSFTQKMKEDKLAAYSYRNSDWIMQCELPKRDLDTVIIDNEVKTTLVNHVQKFIDSRAWYEERGLPYKLVVVLHGVPGTGKTSLIRGICSKFDRSICTLNLNTIGDEAFDSALKSMSNKHILVLEDVHSVSALTTGEVSLNLDGLKDNQDSDSKKLLDTLGLSLTGFLNTLDGVIPLDGQIIFMTTNYIDRLDPAILRQGRTDLLLEIEPLTHSEVCEYIKLVFGVDHPRIAGVFDDITGSALQALYFENMNDVQKFIASIPKQGSLREITQEACSKFRALAQTALK